MLIVRMQDEHKLKLDPKVTLLYEALKVELLPLVMTAKVYTDPNGGTDKFAMHNLLINSFTAHACTLIHAHV